MPRSSDIVLSLLRVGVAALLITHGVVRLQDGGVGGFGVFLSSQSIPFGLVVAWVLTVVEIAGGLALAIGHWVRPLCLWFMIELVTGIALVHAREGWFVVGKGRNGMEYSALLILCLLVISMTSGKRARRS